MVCMGNPGSCSTITAMGPVGGLPRCVTGTVVSVVIVGVATGAWPASAAGATDRQPATASHVVRMEVSLTRAVFMGTPPVFQLEFALH
jgi:hypothetical protein